MSLFSERVERFFKSETIRDLVKISVGKFGNAFFAFLVSILIARNLSTGDFGLFSLSLSILIITLEVSGSEGLDNGLVRFSSQYLITDNEKADLYFKVTLKLKLFLSLAVVLLGILFTEPLLIHLFNKPELKHAVLFGIAGGGCASLWRYTLAVLQSYERFTKYALLTVVPNLSKIVFVLFFLFINSLNIFNALTINVVSVFIGFIAGYMFIPKRFFFAKGDQRDTAYRLVHFSKWIILSCILYALFSRLDVFMLSYYTEMAVVGVYSAALTFITAIDLIYISILTRLLPQASKLSHQHEFISHIKKSLLISVVCVFFMAPLFLIARPIVLGTFQEKYIDAIGLFQVLLIGSMFTLIFNPLLVILYAKNRPQNLTIVYIIQLSLSFIGHMIYIPRYGAMGSAAVVSSVKILGGILVLFMTLREIYRPAVSS